MWGLQVSVKRYTDMQLLTSRQVLLLLLLRPQNPIIRTLALRHDGKMARLSWDVRLKVRKISTSHLSWRSLLLKIHFIRTRRLI